jgi:hypothetical protein
MPPIHRKNETRDIMHRPRNGKRLTISLLRVTVLLTLLLLTSCSSSRPVHFKNVAKSDVDLVADAHLQKMNALLKNLLVKLYKRNPRELHKEPYSVEFRLAQLFGPHRGTGFSELDHKDKIDAILLSFDDAFKGDRVFALMVGLTSMIRSSYNNQEEFFMFDSLDQQKLYNSARNIEILAWRLANKQNRESEPYLLTNSLAGEPVNLSFERLFGQMIAVQDMMARIVADRTNRTINLVVQTLASAVFLP